MSDAFAEQRIVAGTIEDAGRERPLAAGDEHGLRRITTLIGGDDVAIGVVNQLLHLLLEADVGTELFTLLDEIVREVAGEDAGEAADVVDVLLGVERGELTAELGKRVDNATGDAAESG